MKDKIINFLQAAFPFLIVLFLWRLSGWFWNPAGFLALIPIFYCTFVMDIPWYGLYGALFCFLIDYKFNTLCFWTGLYCLFYAINGFQSVIDLKLMSQSAINAFMLFIGLGLIILVITNFSFMNMLRGIWMFILSSLLYIPVTDLIKRVRHD